MPHQESQGVIDQAERPAEYCHGQSPPIPHELWSIKTGAPSMPWIEACANCGWIDASALERQAAQVRKEKLSTRASQIALAAETEPFAFVQSSGQDLTLNEVIGQALGAASMCWEKPEAAGEFNASRAKRIWEATMAEIRAGKND